MSTVPPRSRERQDGPGAGAGESTATSAGRPRTARRRRAGQRGSQSLEWVTLGGLVATVMVAATRYVQSDSGLGATVAQAILKPVRDMLGNAG